MTEAETLSYRPSPPKTVQVNSSTAFGLKKLSRIRQCKYLKLREIPHESVRKGFYLAHFLVLDRRPAIEILIAAIEKLKGEERRQSKRLTWRETSMKRKLTAMVRYRNDLFQWLILREATKYERQMERRGTQTTADMIVRYIKEVVQITTARSTFYVSVGVQRLLYDFTTT